MNWLMNDAPRPHGCSGGRSNSRRAQSGALPLFQQPAPRRPLLDHDLCQPDHRPAHGDGHRAADLLSVAQAKALVLKHRVAILEGHCPLAERRAARAARRRPESVTFRECADHFIKAHAGSWRSAEHARQWTVTLTRHVFPVMGHLPVGAVGTAEVMQVLEPLWHAKPETASRIRGRIEQVLDYAGSRHWRSGDNPARWRGHIANLLPSRDRLKPTKHLAAVPWPELPALWRALDGHDRQIPALALKLVLLTATRPGEAMGAQWGEIDRTARVWTIPAARTKSNRTHRVPLSDAALDVLDKLAALRTGDCVFPGARHGRPIDSSRPLLVLREFRPDATLHGFRSGFRDWASEQGIPGEVAEAALAHAITDKTEAAYRRGDLLEPRRAVVQRWADYLAEVVRA